MVSAKIEMANSLASVDGAAPSSRGRGEAAVLDGLDEGNQLLRTVHCPRWSVADIHTHI